MPRSSARVAALLVCLLPIVVQAATTFIADDRIRNPNLTPTLGRGFSLTTYNVLSTCLDFEEKTEPTYNYDYDMMEITKDGKSSSTAQGSFKASMSWGFIKATVTGSANVKSESTSSSHYIVTKMSMERYYSSVDDTTATLTPDALGLINKGDLFGYFQACGSGYIRSLRRTAEVTAVFELSSNSATTSKDLAASLKISVFGRGGGGGSFSLKSTSFTKDTNMKIHIKAFGLGLNMDGADTLVARSLADYDQAIKFAFKSMQNEDVGMIRGVEIVPWMDNLQFQNAINFVDMNVKQKDGTEKAVKALEVKAITAINGEFLQMIDSTYRNELYLLALMRRCVGDLDLLNRADNGKYQNYYLLDHTGFDMKFDASGITVKDLISVVNMDTLREKFKETQAFIHSFYGPCTEAMVAGSDNGRMVNYWFSDPKCDASCLLPNVKYVETEGKAVSPGKDADGKPLPAEQTGALITCTAREDLNKDPTGAKSVAAALQAFTLESVVERFCMPELDKLHLPPGVEPEKPKEDK